MNTPSLKRIDAFDASYDSGLSHLFLHALLSHDTDDLKETISLIDKAGVWPNNIRQDLQGLYSYRTFYDESRMADFDESRKHAIRKYDWEWALEIAYNMYGYFPAALLGQQPLPPRLAHLSAHREHALEFDPE